MLYVSKSDIAVYSRIYHTAARNHMPYGITQCYLPPDSGDFTAAEAGTQFSDPWGMQGWVDLERTNMYCESCEMWWIQKILWKDWNINVA